MPKSKSSRADTIAILTGTVPAAPAHDYGDMEPRRGDPDEYTDLEPRRTPKEPKLPQLTEVSITHLQQQVNVFLTQLGTVMKDPPEPVGGFRVDEFEVSVGIVVEGKGEIKLALIANAEVGAGINAGIKFVFKRT
jgi:hypothetical protein